MSTLAAILLLFCATAARQDAAVLPKEKLSEYGFFAGNLRELVPTANVLPYSVNAPLFSDYAEKSRFIALPDGAAMTYRADGAFELPTGAVLIKNFYYSHEQAHSERGRKLLETRLLQKTESGWEALTYLWDDAQTDATLEVAGASFPVAWRDAAGKKRALEYVVPNVNQCKGCHSFDGRFVPLGVTARQLNCASQDAENQLLAWQKQGRLVGLPDGFQPENAPRLADYLDDKNPDLNARARAYLDANCGHCHNAHGPASTSGMFLDFAERDPERIGIGKPPVAAGRGSGDRRFGIVPGKPSESILLFRMESSDPGIQMPELGRQMTHREGIELIKNWIRAMK